MLDHDTPTTMPPDDDPPTPMLHEATETPLFELLADPTHLIWREEGPMPDWLTEFRPHQIVAMSAIIDAFTRTNVVILDAPVGSGKTVIAEMVRRILRKDSVYICSTKTLQDQFVKDFPHARLLKGRANYPTQYAPFPGTTAADCTATMIRPCMFCDERSQCPYNMAKGGALGARTAVLNTAYFLTEANGPGAFAGRGFAVADEADLLESTIMGHVEVEIGDYWQRTLGIDPPKVKTAKAKSNDWEEWAIEAYNRAQDYQEMLPDPGDDVKKIRYAKRVRNLVSRLGLLAREVGDGGWVYDGYNRRNPTIIFKPVMVKKLAPDVLFAHAGKWLLMSGSVISASEMAYSLGIDNYESVEVHTGWDNTRRPVWVAPVDNVIYKNKDKAYPSIAEAVVQIIEAHPDERILVHGVSYDLTKFIVDEVYRRVRGRDIFTYTQASEREPALQRYMATPASVIIAPSLDRGVDFKDDLARVQVVCKVPWPSLGDKQVSTRANMGAAGDAWFMANTVRSFVQMIGRGMRHEDDWCITYVLDKQMKTAILGRRGRSTVPGWVKDSVRKAKDGERPWLDVDSIREDFMREGM